MLYCYQERKRRGGRAIKICCFTGHRTITEAARTALVSLLDTTLRQLYTQGFREFRVGGARGFDTLAALRIIAFRQTHEDCRLVVILPCRDQAKGWCAGERAIWQEIQDRADTVRCLFEGYTPECMHARNRALVDGSDLCVAYLTENRGGTLYTCSYALKNGVELLNLAEEHHK